MYALTDMLRRLAANPGLDESFVEVVDSLANLRDQRTELLITSDDPGVEFSGAVTALDPRHRVIVIDAPDQEEICQILRPGSPMTLRSLGQGRKIEFRTRFLEPFMPNPDMGLQLKMPVNLSTKQPRGAVRVFMDNLGKEIGISIGDGKGEQVSGLVRNISRSGVSMKTQQEFGYMQGRPEEKMVCRLSFNGSDFLDCRVEVRNVFRKSNGENLTFVGGRMTDIDRRDANRLSEFIQSLQRERVSSLMGAT